MSRRRPYSQRYAYWQTIHAMERFFCGHNKTNKELIKRIACMIAIIWKVHQVGLFQLRLKHLNDYLLHHNHHTPKYEKSQEIRAIQMLCEYLDKAHWPPLLKIATNNISVVLK